MTQPQVPPPRRRRSDRPDPVAEWCTRLFALLLAGAAFWARHEGLFGETPLVVVVFLAGMIWQHESLLGALRTWRGRQGGGLGGGSAAPRP